MGIYDSLLPLLDSGYDRVMDEKRKRNTRVSKYRPRTDEQKARRQELRDARRSELKIRARSETETKLRRRLDELELALRDLGRAGIDGRRHTRPLEDIIDDAERLGVLKARVERLEALWSIDRRKRETRGKILIGSAIIAELTGQEVGRDEALPQMIMDILEKRVATARDTLIIRELLRTPRAASNQEDPIDRDDSQSLDEIDV